MGFIVIMSIDVLVTTDCLSVLDDNAYKTIHSVMTAERARRTNKIRSDINADRPTSAKKSKKKKKKIEAKLTSKLSDTDEDISEKPSSVSKTSTRSDGSSLTPRGGPAIDHHIKYSENEKLKKWLKEKNKLYRQNIKEEKRKKREEREKLVLEANEKLERKLESQKRVSQWMKEKNKEEYLKHKKEKKQKSGSKTRKEIVLPADSAEVETRRREDDVTVEVKKCRGQETPDYVKDQIHSKREIEEENKQASVAAKGPHPPQTKFIYKRPVAGKIKLNMQTRGKSPVGQRPESAKTGEEEEKEKNDRMRMSYDEWIKRKREDDNFKKKNAAKMKQNELAKSDPELNRLIPDLAKRRIEEKLNSRKKISTGIKQFDEKANKSYGGGEFNNEVERERPRSAYRLEGETVKQSKRPSTAPVSRGRMPLPKKSASSPRKAIIPKRVDKVMDNKDDSNPYTLPFPPEKGIPPHVAARQRKLFADRVADKLSESEQRELLQEVLEREGVAYIDEGGEMDKEKEVAENDEPEAIENGKQSDITTLMYSPRKKEDTSDSSDSEDAKRETACAEDGKPLGENVSNEEGNAAEIGTHIDSFGTTESGYAEDKSSYEVQTNVEVQNSNQYRTYENLNELNLEAPNTNNSNVTGADLGVDIEKLRERVEFLTTDSTEPPLLFSSDPRDSYESRSTDDDPESEPMDSQNIKIISEEPDPNLVGILKETKRKDDIPVPGKSEEPTEIHCKTSENGNNGDSLINADESFNASRKRVSFNEQTEVFQSTESTSSTDTLTPDQEDFDPSAESLDAQPDYADDFEADKGEDQGEKLSFNIGGFELNPTVINPPVDDGQRDEGEGSTFITNPE